MSSLKKKIIIPNWPNVEKHLWEQKWTVYKWNQILLGESDQNKKQT